MNVMNTVSQNFSGYGIPGSMRVSRRSSAFLDISSTSVSTILSSIERVKVDVISQGAFIPLHRNTFDEILLDLRSDNSKAVLISASMYNVRNSAKIAELTREFPRVPTYAILTPERNLTHVNAHYLGRLGIRKMIDVRNDNGWESLRKILVREYSDDIRRTALGMLNFDLIGCPLDCWLFFEILFTHDPHIQNVGQISRVLNVSSSTLLSRFYRSNLPSPKRYIDMVRMIRVARLLENSGLSISAVARHMKYSSPQAFSRSTRLIMKMTPADLRKTYTGEEMIEYFRDRLILPYRNILRSFKPVSAEPAWITYSNGVTHA